jgi:PIN domain nuclease of toxin-antitoxin system
VRVLLDTHLVLWTLFDLDRIGGDAARLLKEAETAVVISAVTLWEISIKRATGKLAAPDDLPAIIRSLGHEILDVTPDHGWSAGALPRFHADPFDRLLVAQSQVERLPLVTHDRQLERYDVRIIRA